MITRILNALETLSETKFLFGLYAVSLILTITFAASLGFDTSRRSDSWGYLFQAELISEGKLWRPAPNPSEPFHYANVVNADGKMYGRYFPGQPLLIALSLVLFGHPYPILLGLCAATSVLVYLILRRIFPQIPLRYSRVLVLPFLLNLDFLTHSSTLLPYGATITFELLGLWLILESLTQRSYRASLVRLAGAAAAFGFEFLIRPTDALIAIVVFGVAWLVLAVRIHGLGRALGQAGVAAAVLSLFGLLMLAYDFMLTGNPFITPYQKYLPGDEPFKFGCVRFNPAKQVCMSAGLFLAHLLDNFLGLFTFLGYRPNLIVHFLGNALKTPATFEGVKTIGLNLLNLAGIGLSLGTMWFGVRRIKERELPTATTIKILLVVLLYSSLADQWPFGYMYLARPYIQLLLLGAVGLGLSRAGWPKKVLLGLLVIFTAYGAFGNVLANIGLARFDAKPKEVIDRLTRLNPNYAKILFVDNIPPTKRAVKIYEAHRQNILLYPFNWDINWYIPPTLDADPMVVRFIDTDTACKVLNLYPNRLPYLLHLVRTSNTDPNDPKSYEPRIEPLPLPCFDPTKVKPRSAG